MAKYDSVKNIALLVLVSSVGLSSCNRKDENLNVEIALRPVRTLTVGAPHTGRVREFTAVVDAARKANLSFKVSGELFELPVKQGERVVRGQVIARLDDTDYRIQLRDAQSSYDKAEADFGRAKQLIKTDTIPRSKYDHAEAQFDSARAKLDSARNNLEYTQLKAPFDGVIARRYTENHQQLNAKESVLALHDLSNVNLKVDVPESIMIRAKEGNSGRRIVAIFDALSDAEYPLEFTEASTQADEVTQTYELTFTMKRPKGIILLPGMTARVRAETPVTELSDANYFLPANVVLKDRNGNYVFVVNDVGEGRGEIARRSVIVGEISQFGIKIFSGIELGERVVTAGMSKVSDGMLVKLDGK